MLKIPKKTILEKLQAEGFPIEAIEQGRGSKYLQYISELILSSNEIAERSKVAWEYKTLQEFGEECFVLRGNTHWSFNYSGSSKTPDIHGWHKGAIEELNYCVWKNVLYQEDGLQFYIKNQDGSYREANPGDRSFDLVRHIAEESGLDSLQYYEPPRWWVDLHLGHANFEAYDLVFSAQLDTDDPRYPWFKKEKAAIVRRETERRLSLPIQSTAVREPVAPPFERKIESSAPESAPKKGALMQLAIDVQERFWGENFDPNERSTWSSQETILSWIKQRHPGISDFNAKAVEKVACPVDRGIR